jgi:predicted nucleic acid-binding protein
MIFLDTGYFIALFTPDDRLHDRATAWSFQLNEPQLVTEYVLWEGVNKFSKPKDRPSAHALVEKVQSALNCELIYASPELFATGMKLHRDRPDKERSLTDCISFHVMRERGLDRALAYDIHFEQAGFEALLRKDPPG